MSIEEIIEEVKDGKLTWGDIVRKYKPEATDEEVDYILWNETCFPFCNETTVKQIHSYFTNPQP